MKTKSRDRGRLHSHSDLHPATARQLSQVQYAIIQLERKSLRGTGGIESFAHVRENCSIFENSFEWIMKFTDDTDALNWKPTIFEKIESNEKRAAHGSSIMLNDREAIQKSNRIQLSEFSLSLRANVHGGERFTFVLIKL